MIAAIHAFFASIVTYLQQNPHMGSILAFLVSFSESLPVIGTIIPGSITMTAMGTLIGAGVLPAQTTIFWSVCGAFSGDFVGYGLGFYFQESLQKIWPFRRYPNWIEAGEKFFQRHGGKSIILGRFIGPARSAVPMIAGLLRMHWLRFAVAAIPSAMIWAFLYITPGILLGALSLEIPAAKTTEFVLIGLGVIILTWLIFWTIQHFFRQLMGFINRKIDQLWNWLSHHHGSKWFITLITNQENPKDHYQLTLALLAILLFALFLLVLCQVAFHGALTHLNAPLFHVLQSFRGPHLDNAFIIITNLGTPKIMIIAGAFLALLLALTKQWRASAHLFILLVSLTLLVSAFKHVFFFSPRPTGFLSVNPESSFPSGHVSLSLGIMGFTAYLIAQRISSGSRHLLCMLTCLILFLIAFSRLYLGAHWFTDVLAAIFLSASMLLITLISYRRHRLSYRLKTLKTSTFTGIILLAFLPIWIASGIWLFPKVKKNTTPYFITQIIPEENWWSRPTQYLPLYRNNRFGEARQPFNLEWLGRISDIQAYLSRNAWILNDPKITLKSTIRRFASKDPQYHLSPLPALYQHQKPELTMIKYLPYHEGIFVLRLWRSAIILSDNENPLWIGSIYLQYPPPKLLSFHQDGLLSFMVKNNLLSLLGNLQNRKTKIIHISKENQPPKIQELHWNGEILLIRDPNP